MSESESTATVKHFQINIIRTEELKPDSYFIDVTVGKQSFSTSKSKSKRQPAWNQSFNFSCTDGDKMTIGLYKDLILPGQRQYLGECEVDIDKIIDSSVFGQEQTANIVLKSNTPAQSPKVVFKTRDLQATFGNINPQKIFVLLIGVKKYVDGRFPRLEGPINDVNRLLRFLRDDLAVPLSHIETLVDAEATRDGILKAIFDLIEKVSPGDTVFFYFSGHGGRKEAPKGWTCADDMVEFICPHDTFVERSDKPTPGIPDRTLSALFRQLAKKAGDNVITVFDCCHSGGLNRSLDNPDGARSMKDLPPISADLDRDIWTWDIARHCQPANSSLTYEGATSHIFLAAAKAEQTAYECDEDGGRRSGAFTHALLKELRKPDFGQITYRELIDRLPKPLKTFKDQVAHCEGANLNRFLFRREGRPRTGVFTLIEKNQGMTWVAEDIGEVQGVVIGTLFEVREREQPEMEISLGILVATEVVPGLVLLGRRKGDAHFDVPTQSVVTIHRLNDFTLKVFIDNSQDDGQGRYRIDLPPNKPDQKFFKTVDACNDADIQVSMAGKTAPDGQIVLRRLNETIYRDPQRQFTPKDPEEFQTILNAISHFHYHLNRLTSSHPLQSHVKMELYRVQPPDPKALLSRHSIEDEFSKRADDIELLGGNDEVVLYDEPGVSYGVDIVNMSNYALYPYLLYFDPSDYSITLIYEPLDKTVATLPPKQQSRVTIGYGAHDFSHDVTLNFNLREGETTDTGYLKLFVSTQHVDMKWLEQLPAFTEPPSAEEIKEKIRNARMELFKTLQSGVWDTWFTRVTVRERGSEPQAA